MGSYGYDSSGVLVGAGMMKSLIGGQKNGVSSARLRSVLISKPNPDKTGAWELV